MEWPFEGTPSEEERAHWDAFVEFYRTHLGRSPTPEDVERILESGGESLLLDFVARGKAEFSGVDETGSVTFRFEDERDG
jgi:hypothetical protein